MKINKLKRFSKLSFLDKIRIVECILFLILAKSIINIFSFKRVSKYLGSIQTSIVLKEYKKKRIQSQKVKSAIALCVNNIPWRTVCLDQAIAAVLMLKIREIPYIIRFGVLKDEKSKKLNAHAWVESYNEVLVGGETSDQYVPVASFVNNF